ncbi:MAG: DUF4349 domain-containing protein [Pseudomonadota bacterium]
MTLIRNSVLVYGLGFLIIFGLRFGVWEQNQAAQPTVQALAPIYANTDFSSGKRNIISGKKGSGALGNGAVTVDQKFEQVANLAAASRTFEDDELRVRGAVTTYEGLIQFEQRAGLRGRRTLQLAIGIAPARFDTLVDDLKAIAILTRFQIDKTDKTNEYRDLQAKKVSLEKSRDSLLALKARDGRIDEMINLENQILNLERQIQDLGVSLGDFDTENEFSTVKISLVEAPKASAAKSLSTKIFDAALWTLKWYTVLWIGLAAAMLSIFVALRLLAFVVGAARQLER